MKYISEHIVDEYGESTYKVTDIQNDNSFTWYDKYELLTKLEEGERIIGAKSDESFTDLEVTVQSSRSSLIAAARYTLQAGVGVSLTNDYFATSFTAAPGATIRMFNTIKGVQEGVALNCDATVVLDNTVEAVASFVVFSRTSFLLNQVHVYLDLRDITDDDLLKEVYMAHWALWAGLQFDPIIDLKDRRKHYERYVEIEGNVQAIIRELDEEANY